MSSYLGSLSICGLYCHSLCVVFSWRECLHLYNRVSFMALFLVVWVFYLLLSKFSNHPQQFQILQAILKPQPSLDIPPVRWWHSLYLIGKFETIIRNYLNSYPTPKIYTFVCILPCFSPAVMEDTILFSHNSSAPDSNSSYLLLMLCIQIYLLSFLSSMSSFTQLKFLIFKKYTWNPLHHVF